MTEIDVGITVVRGYQNLISVGAEDPTSVSSAAVVIALHPLELPNSIYRPTESSNRLEVRTRVAAAAGAGATQSPVDGQGMWLLATQNLANEVREAGHLICRVDRTK